MRRVFCILQFAIGGNILNRIVKITKISTCEESTGCSLSTGLWPPLSERKIIVINLFHSLPFEEFGFRLFLALTLTDKHGQHSVTV